MRNLQLFLFILCAVFGSGAVVAAEASRTFDVPAGDAADTLRHFAQQAGREIVYPANEVRGRQTNAVKGTLPVTEALVKLLAGTRLLATTDVKTGALSVTALPEPPKAPAAPRVDPAVARPAATPNDSEAIVLSPFSVSTARDRGYAAENTLAGSRLNSSLRDTPSSVTVLTKEFLDDLAITDLSRMVDYTVNTEMDTNAQQPNSQQNPQLTGENLVQSTLVRGLAANQGMDYFMSITNTDPYRVARYEDTRGPNSILFGIGAPGGMLNQTSKVASPYRDSVAVRHSFGSWHQNRTELDANKVLQSNKLAVSLAGLDMESGGWRQFDFQDKKRMFGSVTYRPVRSLTFQVMGEVGHEVSAVMKTLPAGEEMLAWYDNRAARGLDAVTVTPTAAAPTAAMIALGITARTVASGGLNHRPVFIENNGAIFDAAGTYVTGTYTNPAVRAPDGTPGSTGSTNLLNDPKFYPREGNASGPGSTRTQFLHNFTLSADWQPTPDLAFNLALNDQETDSRTQTQVAADPVLRGEANRTLGLNGPANPFAGGLYFDGNWSGGVHYGSYRESRLTASYTLRPAFPWLGQHRLAAAFSHSEQKDVNALSMLSLVGRPFNPVANSVNNRVIVRNYVTEGDFGTYRVGDWRRLPAKFNFLGKTYDTAFVNYDAGANNNGVLQTMNARFAVVQSTWLTGRLVTTLGYREDRAQINQLGYHEDPVLGQVIDADPAKFVRTDLTARTNSTGAVLHLTGWLSLIANRSSNVGIPTLARTIFPLGNLAGLSHGRGQDYGLDFNLLEGRLSARVVYFDANVQGQISSNGLSGAPGRNTRVMDAFGGVLVGNGLPFSASQWSPLYRAYTPPVSSVASDFKSKGYEAHVTANLTPNWRLMGNFSYTNSGRTHLADEMVAWYGIKAATGGSAPLVQPVTQTANGQYVVDPTGINAGGAIAKWVELGKLNPNANLSTLTTDAVGTTVAQEIYALVDQINSDKLNFQRRWGVRPYKVSLFTAYDFRAGRLNGFTIGGGWHWRSANIIGSDSTGNEIVGREISAADAMLAYSTRLKNLPGRVRFQVNVSNALNQTDIIPVRLSTGTSAPDGFVLPGGRGTAYSRYDLVAPREIRFTTTYSY